MVMNIEKLADDLEKQELEAWSQNNNTPTPQVYSHLLAVYLFQHDLCNAKYLWKRIPAAVKNAHPELAQIWTVGQHMWKRDYPATYTALSAVSWPEPITEIMKALKENIRNRAINLIGQAYSSLSVEAVSVMTDLNVNEVGKMVTEQNWKIEPESHMVLPCRPLTVPVGETSSEDQLYKLTEFVSFLEN